MTKPQWISINRRVNPEFKADPMLAPRPFEPDPVLAQPQDLNFKDYMIRWYKDPKHDPT